MSRTPGAESAVGIMHRAARRAWQLAREARFDGALPASDRSLRLSVALP